MSPRVLSLVRDGLSVVGAGLVVVGVGGWDWRAGCVVAGLFLLVIGITGAMRTGE